MPTLRSRLPFHPRTIEELSRQDIEARLQAGVLVWVQKVTDDLSDLCHLAAWFAVRCPDVPVESQRVADLLSLVAAVVTLNVFSRKLHLYQINGPALLIEYGLHWVYSSDIATVRTSSLHVA